MALRLGRILEDRGISRKDYARLLGVSEKALYNKLVGTTEFTYGEAKLVRTSFPEYNLDYLLSENETPYSA